MKGMCDMGSTKDFYNLIFNDEFDMITWCELYGVSKDVFDIVDSDDEGKFHVAFSSDCVPKYHKENILKYMFMKEASPVDGEKRNGRAKSRTTKESKNRPKKSGSQIAYQQFLLR